METAEKRVARGAAFLDHVAPGWEGRVDLGKLDVASVTECPCGQVWREEAEKMGFASPTTGWWYFIIMMRTKASRWMVDTGQGTAQPAIALGFYSPEDFGAPNVADYKALTQAWTALIKERFDTGALSGS